MRRREFLQTVASVSVAAAVAPDLAVNAVEARIPGAKKLPRWRGFNLLEKFTKRAQGNPPFQESDFSTLAEWGFDFVRLPMSYLCWTDAEDWLKLREGELKDIDAAIELGRQHGVHVNLNFHRAPGYCVNPPKEPLDLWKDEKALEACAFHWGQFAKRYKGVANERVSFDLLNEPPDIPEETYVRVVKRLVEAIRAEDPQRRLSPMACVGVRRRCLDWWNWASRRARVGTNRCGLVITAPTGFEVRTNGRSLPGRSRLKGNQKSTKNR